MVKTVKTYKIEKQLYFHEDTIRKYKRLGRPLPEYEKKLDMVEEYNREGMRTLCDRIAWMKEEISFDPANNKTNAFISEKRYDSDGKPGRVYEQILDDDGLPKEGKAVDGDGNLIFTETYEKTVNPDGTINIYSQHISANSDPTHINITLNPDYKFKRLKQTTPIYQQDIIFDEEERPISVYEKRRGVESNLMLEYTSDGHKVYKLDSDGKKILFLVMKNDPNGNLISSIQYNPQGEAEQSETYVYTYDNHGNWTRREIRKSDSPDTKITEREITYY
ncbi:MAG: hypothetical protein K2M31_01515 [Muribaculaceae bacterium]|nr:hypothetical protein [Muribaculaceae bacterium]